MSSNDGPVESLDAQISAQGDKVRDLKSQKATKDAIDAEVKTLLALKVEFKKVAGRDWSPKGCIPISNIRTVAIIPFAY